MAHLIINKLCIHIYLSKFMQLFIKEYLGSLLKYILILAVDLSIFSQLIKVYLGS